MTTIPTHLRQLEFIADGWLELESDPGLFTVLLEDLGVKGVEVKEIYDIETSFDDLDRVLGFILLTKVETNPMSARRRRRELDKGKLDSLPTPASQSSVSAHVHDIGDDMFFAKQIVDNSCATHALLMVLMNCQDREVDLGPVLREFKEVTKGLNSDDKGHAVNNSAVLAAAHNRRARPLSWREAYQNLRYAGSSSKGPTKGGSLVDTFHYVSYVPHGNRVYELDGMKLHPTDRGPVPEGCVWHETVRQVVIELINRSEDIWYNLLAVVPSEVFRKEQELKKLAQNQRVYLTGLERLLGGVDMDACYSGGGNIPSSAAPDGRRRRAQGSATASVNGYADGPPAQVGGGLNSAFMDRIARTRTVVLQDEGPAVALNSMELGEVIRHNATKISTVTRSLEEERQKFERYREDDVRRTHDYDDFIRAYFQAVVEEGTVDLDGFAEDVENCRSAKRKKR